MTSSAHGTRWIVSPRFDALWFIAPGFVSLLIAAPVLMGVWDVGAVSPLAWLLMVVFIDVAHVWTTLFRTYLDKQERERRPWLYWGLPTLVFAGGFLVHSAQPNWFWTLFAYVAVHHFIKQQFGFISLYRYRANEHRSWVRRLDKIAVYTGAGVPVLYWHTTLPRDISWFVEGDFIGPLPAEIMVVGWCVYGLAGAIWVFHRLIDARINGAQWGRDLTMLATWLTWYIGIVVTDVDFVFTVTNVVIHGVPYAALVWHSSRRQKPSTEKNYRPNIAVFVGLCLMLAFIEEGLWDLTVWHDHAQWFGTLPSNLSHQWLVDVAVPLLMVPQGTHYLLDGFIWRMDASNPGLKTKIFRNSRPLAH